jgi:hypothetical protein
MGIGYRTNGNWVYSKWKLDIEQMGIGYTVNGNWI